MKHVWALLLIALLASLWGAGTASAQDGDELVVNGDFAEGGAAARTCYHGKMLMPLACWLQPSGWQLSEAREAVALRFNSDSHRWLAQRTSRRLR